MEERAAPSRRRLIAGLARVLIWFLVSLFALWSLAALFFDVRSSWLRYSSAAVFLFSLAAALILIRRPWLRLAAWTVSCIAVLFWWLSLNPSNTRDWQTDVSQTAWAEVRGDRVVIHGVRDCDYRSEFDYTCNWETRPYDLSQLRGIDGYIVYWGSPWIAHTMISFQFGSKDFIAFSIETRKVVGQVYSAIKGFFRQYELIYIAADERDVVRLRTNYRKDEDVYLYHLNADPARARQRFLEYIARLNDLHEQPEWYNALTRNCTTSIFAQRKASAGALPPLDVRGWRVLLNGKLDELLYRDGVFAGGLPFEELKRRAGINPAARAADHDPEFSLRIREGRPGFADLPAASGPAR